VTSNSPLWDLGVFVVQTRAPMRRARGALMTKSEGAHDIRVRFATLSSFHPRRMSNDKHALPLPFAVVSSRSSRTDRALPAALCAADAGRRSQPGPCRAFAGFTPIPSPEERGTLCGKLWPGRPAQAPRAPVPGLRMPDCLDAGYTSTMIYLARSDE